MSKLNKLIQELCPNGVEYRKLGEVCEFQRGQTITAKDAVLGEIPVLAGGQKPAYYHNIANRTGRTVVVAGSGAYAGYISYWEIPIFVSDAFSVNPSDELHDKFLFYFLKNIQNKIYATKKGSGVPHVHGSSIAKFEIPLPPLPIQEEIVKILDRFAEYTAELQTELQARKEQYEYYRNLLLTNNFAYGSADGKQKITGNAREEWKWMTLGEVCDVYTGGEPPKDTIKGNFQNDINKYPVYGNGKDVYGYSSVYRIDKDATVISSIGANTGAIYFREAFFTPIIRLKVVVPKDNRIVSKFLYYYLSTVSFAVKSSSVPNMNANEVKKLKVPVLPLAEQQRIVSILDKFEALVSDLTQGLPAEIAASQERYEYYRDKLLRFERCN